MGVKSCNVVKTSFRHIAIGTVFVSSALAFSPKFNFGAASPNLPLLFGVEAPGVPMKPGGKYNEKGSVPNDVVAEWASFLEANDVTRALCLLKQDELDCYDQPGYASLLEDRGVKPFLVDVFQDGASEKCIAAYQEAAAAGEKIAVHCSGGEGRTGVVLGALLVQEAGMDAEAAEAEILASADEGKVTRKLSAAKVQKLLDEGTLA
eukprot:CAMPEP_0197443248 /NCGR_PEP_ID=MMETSP1175-20131217/9032_1 /TAXON_ID=1003142 /ORGANISM="Triceratium dubium, Strain CCMP147" /LENGTH=205 /DNA_ID=CAMNT_0042973851 /DNA_START=44 /DNA_END=661 /DNA_ORIENTATION=-